MRDGHLEAAKSVAGLHALRAIAILGPGGVGGFLAAALARAGTDVVVIARPRTAELIARDGIDVQSARLGEFEARPAASPVLREPAGVLVIATKARGLEAALERIETPPELVVPLLNGLDHLGVLRAAFGQDRVAAGAIRIESYSPAPRRIVQAGEFLSVDLAADHGAAAGRLPPFAAKLEASSVPTRIGSSEAQIMWDKLVRLNALACTTSATDLTIGFIRADPELRAALVACIEEAAAVASAEGADVDPADAVRTLDDAHAALGSSMQRDLAAGHEPELDAIAGAVLRAAARHDLECPTIERLSAEIALRAGIPPPRI